MQTTLPTKLDNALWWATKAVPVLPLNFISDGCCSCGKSSCASPGKHPIYHLVRHGLKDATTDPDTIKGWWTDVPEANIGVRTGLIFDVIDIDGPEAAVQYEALVSIHGVPTHLGVARTGREGGQHVYVIPGGQKSLAGGTTSLPGIDVKSTGGYVVAPGSLHASGRTYEWERCYFDSGETEGDTAWADFHGVLNRSRPQPEPSPRPTVGAGTDFIDECVDIVLGSTAGNRWDTLATVAVVHAARGIAGGSVDGETVVTALQSAGRDIGLREDELNRVPKLIADVLAKGIERPIKPFTELASSALTTTRSRSLASQLLDSNELDSLPEQQPLIAGVLMQHSLHLLSGRDGTYKTFVAFDWAACLASGKLWQGREVNQGRVLYMAGEGAYGLQKRQAAWVTGWQTPLPAGQLTVLPCAVNLLRDEPRVEELCQLIADNQYVLVVVDTLRRFSGGADENATKDMGAVVDNLEKLKRAADGSVLTIAHTQRSDKDTRGASSIEDDTDIVWHTDKKNGQIELENQKMKDGPPSDRFLLRPSPVLDSIVLARADGHDPFDENVRAPEIVRRVWDSLFSHTGATRAELRSILVDDYDMSRATAYRAIDGMVAGGAVVLSGNRLQAPEQMSSH